MTACQLLGDLQRRGLTVTADGPDLLVRGPRALLTPDLKSALLAQKPELLALLTDPAELEQESACPNRGQPRFLCSRCRKRPPEPELLEVAERVGRGFRCLECLLDRGTPAP